MRWLLGPCMLRPDNTKCYSTHRVIQPTYLSRYSTSPKVLVSLQQHRGELLKFVDSKCVPNGLTNFINFKSRICLQCGAEYVTIAIDEYQILIIRISTATHGDLLDDRFRLIDNRLRLSRCSRHQIEDVNGCNRRERNLTWEIEDDTLAMTYSFHHCNHVLQSNADPTIHTSHWEHSIVHSIPSIWDSNAIDRRKCKLIRLRYPIRESVCKTFRKLFIVQHLAFVSATHFWPKINVFTSDRPSMMANGVLIYFSL